MRHLGDITKINGADAEPVDCIIGGSPCQDLSIAGKRAGLAGARSGLYMEQVRVIQEMRRKDEQSGRTGVLVRPRYMVWENVPGALSSNGGRDFAAVLEEAIRIAEPQTPGISVPERGWPAYGGFRDLGGRWSVAWRILDAQYWGVPQRRRRIALVVDFGGDTAHEILFVRQSVPGNSEPGAAAGERPAGAAQDGASYAVRIRGTVTAEEPLGFDLQQITNKTNRFTPKPVQPTLCGSGQPHVIFNMTHANDVIWDCGDMCPTLQNRMGTGGNQVPLCFGIGNGQANEASIMMPEAAQTLNAMHDAQAVLHTGEMAVRRLTPLECERLQGFPDGWTDIGDWTDSSGKKRVTSDSARYKALGNSIALPPWKWVLKRLCASYERDATMGSLFDGIGGFPLIWEQLNGKGSCRWASEIEEFPMAVTRRRFGEEAQA
nr:MAG TPA: Cytosine specific methyltransferase [Caudoviricetes sp.]